MLSSFNRTERDLMRYPAAKDVTCVSKSAEKLKNEENIEVAIDESTTYALLSFTLVFSALQSVLICKACKSDIKFFKKSQVGLGFNLCIKCTAIHMEIEYMS
ncbi:hypothetical protein M0804_013428 [Polistes exclamans]|nr:hypothetical protein M0804_013428 [Polistes exclamans]